MDKIDMKTYSDIEKKLNDTENELKFYKSLFKSHRNSVIFNLSIKKINNKPVWVDHVRDNREYLLSLDSDDEIKEWLKPVRCER
jgi:hypothetical protein